MISCCCCQNEFACLFIHHFFRLCVSSLCQFFIWISLVLFEWNLCHFVSVKKSSISSHIVSFILKPVSKSWQCRKRWSKGVGIETKISELMNRDYFPSRIASYATDIICKAGNGSSCCIRSLYLKPRQSICRRWK